MSYEMYNCVLAPEVVDIVVDKNGETDLNIPLYFMLKHSLFYDGITQVC